VRSIDCVPGYLDDPEATAALFDSDGYLKTGDIVEEREPGVIAWIDRRQSVVKLAQGIFVAPTRLEFLYVAGSSYIQQMYLYANPKLAFLLAVIVPNLAAFDAADAADPAAVRRILRGEIDRVSRTEQLRSQDVPRDFIVELEPFSEANGLLLETLKQSPRRLRERYAPVLDALGKTVEGRQVATQPAASDGSVSSQIRAMLATVLGLLVDELSRAGDASFTGFGGDSVSALRFCSLIETAFGASIPVGMVLDPSSTIATTIARVEALLGRARETPAFADVHGSAATVVQASDLRRLVRPPAEASTPRRTAGARSLLLTGASGFLGRVLVLELVRRLPASGQLTCIVRGRDDRAARERMRAAFAQTTPELTSWFDDVTSSGRLVLVAGDLQAPRFGLAQAAYDELAARIDAIVHNGALVNHAMSYRDLFEPNVLGSLEIARLAARRPELAVTFTSSIAVAVRGGDQPAVGEDDRASVLWPSRPLGGGPEDHAVGYATSKWAGEVLFEELHERHGTPVNVVRCSNIAPHRELPAHLNWADMTNRLLLGIAATGLAPESFYEAGPADVPPRHDIVPLDTVASAIADVAVGPSSGFRIVHASGVNGAPVSLDSLVGWAESAGLPIRRLPHAAWYPAFRDALERLPAATRSRSPLVALTRWSSRHARDRFAPIETRKFEQQAGDRPVVLDEDRVHAWIRALRDS
jgi:fatty acid CoA ligase FadD9